MAADGGGGSRDLLVHPSSFEEQQLSVAAHERRHERNELRQRTDRSGRYLIKSSFIKRARAAHIFGTGTQHRDVRQPESLGLGEQPIRSPLHGLDEHNVRIGARDREHETG